VSEESLRLSDDRLFLHSVQDRLTGTRKCYKKLNYDPINDFQAISLYAITQNLFVLNPSFPVKTVKDLIALAKANPGKYNMANAGSGFQSHLAGDQAREAEGRVARGRTAHFFKPNACMRRAS
jgi:hypothetical protein